MPQQMEVVGALAVCGVVALSQQAFVPGLSGTSSRNALRGSTCAQAPSSKSSASFGNALSAGVLATSVGFALRHRSAKKTYCRAFDPAVQEGVTQPFGFFDPLGFTKGKDEAGFRKLRISEIKHGRVAMMASIGLVLPHFWKAPGFENVPNGISAVFSDPAGIGFAVLFLGAGFHELVLWKDDPSKDPGNFGDPFKFGNSINVERNYELNNGRMAMFAVLGQIVAELVTGKDAVQQLGL